MNNKIKEKMRLKNNLNRFKCKLIIIVFFNFLYLISIQAQTSKISIVTIDSIIGFPLNNHYVIIDGKYNHSLKDSNYSQYEIDFNLKECYELRITQGFSYGEIIYEVCKNRYLNKDTTLVVKLPYKFEKRQLPIFFYDKNEIFPDSTFLKDDMEATYFLCKKQKINNIIIQINCCFSEDEIDTNLTLIMKRVDYLKALFHQLGADTNFIEIYEIKYKPYTIRYLPEITDTFRFMDIIDEEYIKNLPKELKPIAERYNNRIEISVRIRDTD